MYTLVVSGHALERSGSLRGRSYTEKKNVSVTSQILEIEREMRMIKTNKKHTKDVLVCVFE